MASQMLSANRQCTGKCRSKQHMNEMINVLSRSTPEQVQSYMLLTCRNFWRQLDQLGRSLVHWAASCGQTDVLDWLLGVMQSQLSTKENESGYTALHLAFLHGQITCAQVLLDYNYGLLTEPVDNEGLTPLSLLHKDANTGGYSIKVTEPTEVYSFGENLSYNLGHAHPSQRTSPEPVDFFRRNSISITQVSMSKFHSLFLSREGEAYVCGHGLGGRLGVGVEDVVISPRLIPGLKCKAVAAGPEHSLFLDINGTQLWGCGSNKYRQLGVANQGKEDKFLEPQRIPLPKVIGEHNRILGCAVGTYHSIFWTDNTIFTFGFNGGQIGHSKEDPTIIATPKAIPFAAGHQHNQHQVIAKDSSNDPLLYEDTVAKGPSVISSVATSDGALLVATGKGDVWLFTNYSRTKIASKQLNLKSVAVSGGNIHRTTLSQTSTAESGAVSKSGSVGGGGSKGGSDMHYFKAEPVRALLLMEAGLLFQWHQDDPSLRRCIFRGYVTRMIHAAGIHLYQKGVLVFLSDGRAFNGHFERLQRPAPLSSDGSDTKHKAAVREKSVKQSSATTSAKLTVKVKKSGIVQSFQQIGGAMDSGVFLEPKDCQVITVDRLAGIHRVISGTCDVAGKNLSFIQQHPSQNLTQLPSYRSSELAKDLNQFLDESSPDDSLHDLNIICGGSSAASKPFSVHTFVLFSRAPALQRMILNDEDEEGSEQEDILSSDEDTKIQNVTTLTTQTWKVSSELGNPGEYGPDTKIFQELLRYLYTDTCSLLTDGSCWHLDYGLIKQKVEKRLYSEANGEIINDGKKGNKKKKRKGANLKIGEQNSGNKKQAAAGSTPAHHIRQRNPLKQLGEMAKKMGLKDLSTRLSTMSWDPMSAAESYKYELGEKNSATEEEGERVVGVVHVHREISSKRSFKLKFDQRSFPELYDIRIRCTDGRVLQAHKCMLAARLEYFRCMLGSGWREAASESPPLTLPLSSELASILLHYLYTDELPPSAKQMSRTEVPELVCRLLIAADQLLAERLREMCEFTLTGCVSLRNVAELLEFAQTYNATQLKETCLQFIGLNLTSILDSNGLQDLDRDCLDAISKYYQQMFPQVERRVLTPRSGAPSLEDVQVAAIQVESSGVSISDLSVALLDETKEELKSAVGGTSGANVTGALSGGRQRQFESPLCNHKYRFSDFDELSSPDGTPTSPKPTKPEKGWTNVSKRKSKKPDYQKEKKDEGQSAVLNPIPGLYIEPNTSKGKPKFNDLSSLIQPATKDTDILLPTPKVTVAKADEEHPAVVAEKTDGLDNYFTRRRRQINTNNDTHPVPNETTGKGREKTPLLDNKLKTFSTKILAPWSVLPGKQPVNEPSHRSSESVDVRMITSESGKISLRDVMAEQEKDAARKQKTVTATSPTDRDQPRSIDKNVATTPSTTTALTSSRRSWATISTAQSQDIGGGHDNFTPFLSSTSFPDFRNADTTPQKVKGRGSAGSTRSGDSRSGGSPSNSGWGANSKWKLEDIIQEEEWRQKERSRLTNKPLWVIQMEEEAMEELIWAYGTTHNYDETITVERVPGVWTEPVWKAHSKHAPNFS